MLLFASSNFWACQSKQLMQLCRDSENWPAIYTHLTVKLVYILSSLNNACQIFTISITGRHRESRRGQLGPLGWRRAGLQNIIGHIFLEELKIKRFRSTEGKWNPPLPLFASPSPFKKPFWSFPHRSGGTVGERGTAVLSSFSSPLSFLFLSADISPPPQSEILFLHRFEQQQQEEEEAAAEVGRWSRQKRQACGPLTTSCSLFCDTKPVPRSVLRAVLSPARHSRRRKSPFQIRISPSRVRGVESNLSGHKKDNCDPTNRSQQLFFLLSFSLLC